MAVEKIQIVEVGARDGLQNESVPVVTADKIELIDRLAAAGITRVEVASFVNPRRVPQMADAEQVVAGLSDIGKYTRIGLVLNRRGLDRALKTGVDEINFVVGASEGFNRANQNAAIDETMGTIEEMVPLARGQGRATTLTISVAFGCPYDGEVSVAAVVSLADRAAAVGVDEIALGDTIGVGVPSDVIERIRAVRSVAGDALLRCHFHDTRNTGIANVVAAIESGVTVIDSSVGGTGGCPYAPNATGNVATEDVLYTLHRMGYETGVDLEAMIDIGGWLGERLGRQPASGLGRAGVWPG